MTAGVAVIGMACRFPRANGINDYWRLLTSGGVVNHPVGTRWDHTPFHRPDDPRWPDGSYTDRVAHLDDVASFPALHFGIAPRRVQVMDPQHRILVELTREALQDAGLERRGFPGHDTGVYVGASVSEYRNLMATRVRARQLAAGAYAPVTPGVRDELLAAAAGVVPAQPYSAAGSLLNMAAANVSSVFDLRGPSFVVDAACSSALVAVHEAVVHLRAGQCDLAVAGGTYLNLGPDNLVAFSRIGAVSRQGICRPFDQEADGFVLGEGAGVVILKRLADALADGDRVHAVIRGSACSNDGRAAGPMTPSQAGQVDCMRRAYRDARLDPGDVGFVECHGSATAVGDAVEIAALEELRKDAWERPAWLSSVKANIGHTMSAAGIASLIKAALVVRHGVVPPQPAVTRPGAAITGTPFRLARTCEEWTDSPRHAAVSSFGFGGTNVHLVLAEPPVPAGPPRPRALRPFVLSAGTPELLGRYAGQLADLVRRERPDLADLAYTLSTRAPLAHRRVVHAEDHETLAALLLGHPDADRPHADHPGTSADAARTPLSAPLTGTLLTLPVSPVATTTHWGVLDAADNRTADNRTADN
ncbi:beta-ketoacyl synthase N-terminal-like domain-containing protein [Streptomyces sp. NPDC048603]|uniref:polyketide synthase n=1 Tax=Streptomyces sp. NPDC048603 TaxID=3365577 RepID=UPI00371E5C77